jgi:hypothetical protein
MTQSRIHLGFSLGAGKPVEIPLDHTAVTGRTQQSGKTTTLEALVHRSQRKAVVFVTKKSESGFREAQPIAPYFQDSGDWEFVSAILEGMLGERLKFERSWIIDSCRGASTLHDVAANVRRELDGETNPHYGEKKRGGGKDKREWLKKPATGLSGSVFTNLNAYFDKILPEIKKLPYTSRLQLRKGLNVMDLSEYSTPLQSLVIRSVLKWVYEREHDTIVIIPEAWEFIPQNRRSPVLLAAEELIRKGAASGNFVWLDSQDIAAVHKNVLRSIGVWILGVQQERNEVKRMIDHMGANPKPQADEVMRLKRGQFFVCYTGSLYKAYVQPFWIADAHARAVATGEEGIESVEKIWREKRTSFRAAAPPSEENAEVLGPDSGAKGSARADGPDFQSATAHHEGIAPTPEADRDAHATGNGDGVRCPAVAQHSEVSFELADNAGMQKGGEETEMFDTLTDEELVTAMKSIDAAGFSSHAIYGKFTSEYQRRGYPSTNGIVPPGEWPRMPHVAKGVERQILVTTPDANREAVTRATHDPTVALPMPPYDGSPSDFEKWLLSRPSVIELLRTAPRVEVKIQRPKLELDLSTLKGQLCRLVADGFFDSAQTANAAFKIVKHKYKFATAVANVYKACDQLCEMGILHGADEGGYVKVAGVKVSTREVA